VKDFWQIQNFGTVILFVVHFEPMNKSHVEERQKFLDGLRCIATVMWTTVTVKLA
jgi:hypothetical protein